jgi:hypothetical protein
LLGSPGPAAAGAVIDALAWRSRRLTARRTGFTTWQACWMRLWNNPVPLNLTAVRRDPSWGIASKTQSMKTVLFALLGLIQVCPAGSGLGMGACLA